MKVGDNHKKKKKGKIMTAETQRFCKEEKNKTNQNPGPWRGSGGAREEESVKIFAIPNCSWKCSPLPEGKLPMLPFQAAASALNSN